MELSLTAVYAAVSLLVAAANLILARQAARYKGTNGRYFGAVCCGAALVDLFYMFSALSRSYRAFSIWSSLYFLAIDAMLLAFAEFAAFYCGYTSEFRVVRCARRAAYAWAALELIEFAVNPFLELSISYTESGAALPAFCYAVMKPLYICHLIYTYLLVAVVLALIFTRMLAVPREYRLKYIFTLLSVGLLVVINAVFLYIRLPSVISRLDLSVLGYTISLIAIYWSSLDFSVSGTLNLLRNQVVNNVAQGIILFDYEDRLIMKNSRAENMFSAEVLQDGSSLTGFLQSTGLELDAGSPEPAQAVQCTIHGRTVRCDRRRLFNADHVKSGCMLVFTDLTDASDLLTGFHNYDHFIQNISQDPEAFRFASAAVADINGLALINSTGGRKAGDDAIRALAEAMRSCLPAGTYFVRGHDAHLIALCRSLDEDSLHEQMDAVRASVSQPMQFAVSACSGVAEPRSAVESAVDEAGKALQVKKLLDRDSYHSQVLTSLMQALQESDADTEAHVKRTQLMGARLGARIGLSDIQQSRLSLLCMLHDIGKIGIPLEVLNKPGRLTDEEWTLMKSHVEKGYQIAMSVDALSCVAEEILHHHESWNGNGYPDRLSGEAIPLLARIIAVVDTYDAIVSNRSYRRARSDAEARAELQRCAGTQFDPHIVSEFIKMLEEHAPAESPAPAVSDTMPLSRAAEMPASMPGQVHPVECCTYVLDDDDAISGASRGFEALTGYSAEDIQSRHLHQIDLIPQEDREEYLYYVQKLVFPSGSVYLEHRLQCRDGGIINVLCYGRLRYDPVSRKTFKDVTVADISATFAVSMMMRANRLRTAGQQELSGLGRRDSLTGLLSRAAFQSDVERMLTDGHRVMMMIVDVDRFREYNEAWGHQAGDEFLTLVGQLLSCALRRDDLACRMGGDEFGAALCFDAECSEAVMVERARQIFSRISSALQADPRNTSVSMGAAVSDMDACTFRRLCANADRAMYSSKQQGRALLTMYSGRDKEN